FCRAKSRPPPRMNSTISCSSSRSNQVPWPRQTSTTTPEQRAKLIRFINTPHCGHGQYWTFTGTTLRGFECGAGKAAPSTAACCARSAQIFSNAANSTQRPSHFSHSRIAVWPNMIGVMSTLHRGHFSTESCAGVASAAAAPQCGQCRLPMNIMPKQEAHEIVASFDSQNWHFDESEEIAAPQLG